MRPFRISPGAQVAHRSLDERDGLPKHGRVEETVGDSLAITRLADEQRAVGYDSRELTRLYMIPGLSRGPIILRPHHLWALVKLPFRRLAAVFRTA